MYVFICGCLSELELMKAFGVVSTYAALRCYARCVALRCECQRVLTETVVPDLLFPKPAGIKFGRICNCKAGFVTLLKYHKKRTNSE